jgi:hypothetical protein
MRWKIVYSYSGVNGQPGPQIMIFVTAADVNAAIRLIPSADSGRPGFLVQEVFMQPSFGSVTFGGKF